MKVVVDSMMWKWETMGLSSCSRMSRRSSSVEKMVWRRTWISELYYRGSS